MEINKLLKKKISNKVLISMLLSFTFLSIIWYQTHIFLTIRTLNLEDWKIYNPGNIPFIMVSETDCRDLFKNYSATVSQAKMYQKTNPHIPVPDRIFIKQASDCAQFRQDRQYINKPLSKEESTFPIAYSILMYKDVEQAERLLRAIYHPQNYYCIHVDNKANNTIKQAMAAIAACFDNVFIASHLVDVEWGTYSALEPEIICMKDLWKYKMWKYFINLTGQEFPLKTNWEIVNILKLYNGTNDVARSIKGLIPERLKYVHQGLKRTAELKSPPPVNVNFTKGPVHMSASRAFVDFILHNQAAQQFLEWVKDTGIPDETFYQTLNFSPGLGVPGAYTGDPDTRSKKTPYLTRFKNWITSSWPCAGMHVRNICIFGVGDLPMLLRRAEMFANKFDSTYEPLAYSCLEEWHFSKIIQEVHGQRDYSGKSFKQHLSKHNVRQIKKDI